jgi:hypothetical protein
MDSHFDTFSKATGFNRRDAIKWLGGSIPGRVGHVDRIGNVPKLCRRRMKGKVETTTTIT